MFQAVLAFNKENYLFNSLKHKQKITIHWIFNSLGLVSILVGYAAIYYNKEEHERPHLTSWHSYLGKTKLIIDVFCFYLVFKQKC